MTAPSAKPLFQAIKPKRAKQPQLLQLPEQIKPREMRDALDFDPTPADATAAFLQAEAGRLRQIGGRIWEPAVGRGDMAFELQRHGFDVIAGDLVDRGYPYPFCLGSFYDTTQKPCEIAITNPPYNEINARDGHGRWLRHVMSLGLRYVAMLLNWDWPAARQNGMDALHDAFPLSRAYVCCWKIDFRGGGSPPQRNGWFVWDADWQGEPVFRRLFRDGPDVRQGALL